MTYHRVCYKSNKTGARASRGNYLPTLSEHPSSPPDFTEVRVAQSFVFCVGYFISLFVRPLLCFAIVLSVLRRI